MLGYKCLGKGYFGAPIVNGAIDKVVHTLDWQVGLRSALGVPTLGAPPKSEPHPDGRVQSGQDVRAPDFREAKATGKD
jgi:hypothetical protein